MGKYKSDEFFMTIAYIVSKQSHCVRKQVGAIIVKDDRIISIGYNGTPKGYINCNDIFDKNNIDVEKHHEFSVNNEIHAEINAIIYGAKNSISLENSTIYVTTSPCHDCAKFIVASGIKNVIYDELYDREPKQPIEFMRLNNVTVKQYTPKYIILHEILGEV